MLFRSALWDVLPILRHTQATATLHNPSNEQFRHKYFIDKAIGYGIEGIQVDGNNILAVHRAVTKIAAEMRENRRPVLLEAMTFRMRGHEEASGTKYVPQELFDMWAQKDPVANYESFLLDAGVLTEELIAEIRAEFKALIYGQNRAALLAPAQQLFHQFG